jgi:hypothetical protein
MHIFTPLFLSSSGDSSGIPQDYEHFYTFDNISGTSIIDEAGTTNMTAVNSPTYPTGIDGDSVFFNGTTQYIDTNMGTDDWRDKSISMWVRSEQIESSTVKYIFSDGNGGIGVHKGGAVQRLRVFNDTTSYYNYSITGVMSNNTWHHMVFYFPSGAPDLYIDGVLRTPSTSTGATRGASGNMTLGKSPTGTSYPFVGNIDHIRIYNRELTEEEITALANEFA